MICIWKAFEAYTALHQRQGFSQKIFINNRFIMLNRASQRQRNRNFSNRSETSENKLTQPSLSPTFFSPKSRKVYISTICRPFCYVLWWQLPGWEERVDTSFLFNHLETYIVELLWVELERGDGGGGKAKRGNIIGKKVSKRTHSHKLSHV